MKNKDLSNMLFGVFFYAIVAGLLIWTASLDYRLIARLIPNQRMLPAFGLVLFDGGLMGWLFTYIYRSRSSLQRLLSAVMTVISLVGIGLFTAVSLIFEAEQVITFIDTENLPNIVVIAIGIQTFLFVASTVLFHLADPEIMEKNAIQSIQTDIVGEALDQFEKLAPEVAQDLTQEMAEMMLLNLTNTMARRIGHNEEFEYIVTKQPIGTAEKEEEKKRLRRERRKARKAEQKTEAEKANPVAIDNTDEQKNGGNRW